MPMRCLWGCEGRVAVSQVAVQRNSTSPEEECAFYVWGPAVRPEWVTEGC